MKLDYIYHSGFATALESPLAVAVTILRVVPVGLKYTARILLMCVICCMI